MTNTTKALVEALEACIASFKAIDFHPYALEDAEKALAAHHSQQVETVIPDECSATGKSCEYGPHGYKGEQQCRYCGAAHSPRVDGGPEELLRLTREVCAESLKNPGKAVPIPELVRDEWAKFLADEPSMFDRLPFGDVKSLGIDLSAAQAAQSQQIDWKQRYLAMYEECEDSSRLYSELRREIDLDASGDPTTDHAGAMALVKAWRNAVQSQQEPVVAKGMVLVPLRPTRAMERVFQEEDWQWGDVLAAAEAVTEEEHAIANNHTAQSQQEPVALTNEQIVATADAADCRWMLQEYSLSMVAFARAIERAHGITAINGDPL